MIFTSFEFIAFFVVLLFLRSLMTNFTAEKWLLLVAIGLATQIGQVFLTKALMIETASRATSIGYIQVAFAMAWQWLVFSDAPTVWTLGGAALIIVGTTAVARASRSATRSDTPA